MLFMLTLGSTEKSCVARKTVVSNKKKNISHRSLRGATKLCESQESMLWQQQKLCDTQKKTDVD